MSPLRSPSGTTCCMQFQPGINHNFIIYKLLEVALLALLICRVLDLPSSHIIGPYSI